MAKKSQSKKPAKKKLKGAKVLPSVKPLLMGTCTTTCLYFMTPCRGTS